MEFIPLYCHIPHEGRKKPPYLCDVEAGVPVTIRCNCRQKHLDGHTNRSEFKIDAFGTVLFKEIRDETDKTYFDDGVRIGE